MTIMYNDGKNKVSVVDESTIKVHLNGRNGDGFFALIDKQDWDTVKIHSWSLFVNTETSFYARAGKVGGGHYSMHRLILNAPNDMDVDHINGDGLDNRRANIRLCTTRQNSQNRKRLKPKKSPYIGVTRKGDSVNCGYTAKITVNGKKIGLGTFPTAEEAARIRDAASKYYFGDFASLNFSDGFLVDFDPSKVVLMKRGKTSKYKGVYKKTDGKWAAFVTENKKDIHLGTFISEEDAKEARENYLNIKEEQCTNN